MGKINDAFERHKKEKTVIPEALSDIRQSRLTIKDKAAVAVAQDSPDLYRFSPKVVLLSSPNSADAEAFRILRGQILYAKHQQSVKTILVTSAFQGEGKSYVTSNLAVSLALGIDERVLAIDCDLRRANLNEMLGVPKKRGLCGYLNGKARFRDVILRTEIENLSVVPAGDVPLNPPELLSSKAIEEFMKASRGDYESRYVLIDSPPVHITAEARILAEHADAIIFVVMAKKSPRKEIQKCIELLGRDKILGVVFNGYSQARKKYYKKYYDKSYK